VLVEAEKLAFAVVSEKNAELPESTRKAIAGAVGIGAVKYADLSKDRVSDYNVATQRVFHTSIEQLLRDWSNQLCGAGCG